MATAAIIAGVAFTNVHAVMAITPQGIANEPHAVQRACAEKILASQGPGAWTGWSGSLDNMYSESGNNDTAINPSSGAAGYYQIMPSSWSAFGCGASSNVFFVDTAGSNSTRTLQHNLNILSGRGLSEDGAYGPSTIRAVSDFARFFHAGVSSVPSMTAFFVTLK
jgi:hypothetical protein